ncbi:hypothetical protein M514_00688 [Trichuris suis]|nr:hypothetical protein M514_00688 [Trichuris suis]KHJ42848.1 hypothetical protein D918_07130 [Trichuris suis]
MEETFVGKLSLLELLKYSQESDNAKSPAVLKRIADERAQMSKTLLLLSALKPGIAECWPTALQGASTSLYALMLDAIKLTEHNQKLYAPQGKKNMLNIELLLSVKDGLELLQKPLEMLPSQDELDLAVAKLRHVIALVQMTQVHFSTDTNGH